MSDETENIENKEEELEIIPYHTVPEHISEFTGYDHLYIMCKEVRNESISYKGNLNPITPRLAYIMDALAYQGQKFEFVPLDRNHSIGDSDKSYDINQDNNKLANVMVRFKGTNQDLPTVIFTAHHDIANPNSENCQDNTASVCNLIHLCAKLKEHQSKGELLQNVVIGFTDLEECGGMGMNMLISQILSGEYGEVDSIFALELTANGKCMWVQGLTENSSVSERIGRLDFEVPRVRTPYNESSNARRVGLPAVCIGTLTESEMNEVINVRSFGCDTWSLCHRMSDTFELSANKEDMCEFVDTMLGMIDIQKKLETNDLIIV